MNAHYPTSRPYSLPVSLQEFVETFSDVCTAITGYGMYAFFSPEKIEYLFQQCAHEHANPRQFAKQQLRRQGF
jgi:cephalosporin-C deacetylase-like acetyl esterase